MPSRESGTGCSGLAVLPAPVRDPPCRVPEHSSSIRQRRGCPNSASRSKRLLTGQRAQTGSPGQFSWRRAKLSGTDEGLLVWRAAFGARGFDSPPIADSSRGRLCISPQRLVKRFAR